jgi:hypothetical protein
MSQQLDTHDSTEIEDAEGDLVESNPGNTSGVKDINLMDSDHPQVQALGSSAIETETKQGLGEFISDFIYENDKAFWREYLQNSETACIRACKYLIRNHPDYGDEWLTQKIWIDEDTGKTIRDYTDADAEQARLPDGEEGVPADPKDLNTDDYDGRRVIEIPRPLNEVVEAARNIGYDPTITIDIYHDEQKIVWEDNGIGMTLYEFKEAFMAIRGSGSAQDEDTGGKFGVGAKSSALAHGKDGGMQGYTKTRRSDVPDYSQEGVSFYSYLGGANLRDNNEIPDDFRGTHFEAPVTAEFDLNKAQDAVEKYTEILNVPVLYQEHRSGQNTVNEEYGGVSFEDYHDNPPVIIERPGEFTVADGPDVGGYKEPDTWLVSMRIDRNAKTRIRSFWNTVLQVHDEQGRIVAGPNRGRYADGQRVYETRKLENKIGGLHDDDVPLPQPVGSRDNFQKDNHNKRFFEYLDDLVEAAELQTVAEIAEEMHEADHPADTIMGEEQKWKVFYKMVDYHGPYDVFERERRFKKFVNERDEFPNFSEETRSQVYALFNEVGLAKSNSRQPNKKRGRAERRLGEILANNSREHTFMGCSINEERHEVVHNTYPSDGTVIAVSGANKYDSYGDAFGFTKLAHVPRKQSDDHEFDVPDHIHKAQQSKSSGSKNRGKADDVSDRTLKIRCDNSNQQIDKRFTVDSTLSRLDNGRLGGHSSLIVFPRGGESISDHYGMQKFGAIISASKEELDEIHHHESVFTYEEYVERARNTPIATELGPIKAKNLRQPERCVVLVQATADKHRNLLKNTDEMKRLRELIKHDRSNQSYNWSTEEHDDPEVVLAVADKEMLNKARYAFYQDKFNGDGEMLGLKFRRRSYGKVIGVEWQRLDGSIGDYRRKAKTPEWDNDSDVYDIFGTSDELDAALFGFHDAGFNPVEQEPEDIREAVGKGSVLADFESNEGT